MKKWFKRGLFAFVFLVIVTLVGGAVFLLTFDPNAYKAKVEQVVYEQYQRHLSIDGEIELSLFPRIGLSVGQVSLTDKNSQEPFASVDSARFAVAVWPLLWNRLVVDHVAVSGFKVWVKRDDSGDFNFTDLLKGSATPTRTTWLELSPIASANAQNPLSPNVSQAEFQIDIAGLDLKEGEIHFSDLPSNTQLRLVNLELNTGRMTFGHPFDVIFKGTLQGEQPVAEATVEGQAVLQLEPHLHRYVAQRMNMSLVGQVGAYQATQASFRGGVELLSLTQDVRGRNIEILTQGSWQGAGAKLQKTNFSFVVPVLDFKQDLSFFKAQKLQLRASGVLPSAQNQPEHKAEVAVDIPRLRIEPNQIGGDPVALSFKQSQGANLFGFSAKAKDFSGGVEQLTIQQIQMELASKTATRAWKVDSTATAQWQQDNRTFSWSDLISHVLVEDEGLNPNPAQAKLTGLGHWALQTQQAHFEGEWQSANTQAQILADLGKEKDQWQLKTKVEAAELDITPWLVSKAPLAAQSPKTKTAEPYRSLVNLMPWSRLDVDLHLESDQLKWREYDLQQVQFKAQKTAEALRVEQLQAHVFEGQMQAAGQWQTQTNLLELKAKLADIDLSAYSKAMGSRFALSGKGQVKADLQTQGATEAARRAALAGTLELTATDGSIQGWDVWQRLEQLNEAVRNVFSGQIQEPNTGFSASEVLAFSRLASSLEFHQGQGVFKNLQWQADGVKVKVEPQGYLDLVNRQMDMDLRVDLQSKTLPTAQASLAPYASHPIFVRLSGPWAQPSYRIQWQRLEQPVVIEAVDQGLLGLLEASEQPLAPEAKPATAEGTSKTIGDTLKDLLKK